MTIRFGNEMDEDYIKKLYELDKIAYNEKYMGKQYNMIKRWSMNNNTFISVEEDAKPIAYINIFPVSEQLMKDVVYNSNEIIDDEIGIDLYTDETFEFNLEKNYLYILSVVNSYSKYITKPINNIQNRKDISNKLIEGYNIYIKELQKKYNLTNIFGATVSYGGQLFAEKIGLHKTRILEDGNIIFLKEF